jgi:HEPN domain-containing protein
MTPDPSRLEDAQRWLAIARDDLEAAAILIRSELYSGALFHCQQAAERALKGLPRYGKPFRKTHDLSDLSADCLAIDPSLDPLLTRAERLTQYAWRFRYPGAPFEPRAADAAGAHEDARALLERIEAIVRTHY